MGCGEAYETLTQTMKIMLKENPTKLSYHCELKEMINFHLIYKTENRFKGIFMQTQFDKAKLQ